MGVDPPHTFEKHWNVTSTQTHVPKRHLNTPAVRLRLQPCSVQPLSINPGSSSEIKDLPRQSSQPIVTLLMNPLTWLARLQSGRCWLKSKDTKGQRQNHLGSLLGCQNGVPVRDNTVGADNLPLIKRRRRRRRVCRPQGECREGEDVRGRKCRRRRFGSLPASIVTAVRWGFKSEIWFYRQVRKTFFRRITAKEQWRTNLQCWRDNFGGWSDICRREGGVRWYLFDNSVIVSFFQLKQ